MRLFTMILGLLRLCLLWLLAFYWVTFVGFTIKYLAAGGPSAVVTWYRHISAAPFRWQWHWGAFLIGQVIILAATLALLALGRRTPQAGLDRGSGL
jgi:hypothetical protein